MKHTLTVGSIVTLKIPCLDNDPGTVGICYEDYGRGSSFIFPNGKYDGFSLYEQEKMLEFVTLSEYPEHQYYKFQNVLTIEKHFREGFWKQVLTPANTTEQ